MSIQVHVGHANRMIFTVSDIWNTFENNNKKNIYVVLLYFQTLVMSRKGLAVHVCV